MDRVNELGDASVPFRFDVHALIFSDDAVGLERKLHREFEANRVNHVNLRREFFSVAPTDVRDALSRLDGQHLGACPWSVDTGCYAAMARVADRCS
jgi:Meiotically up-regulated gene 113